MSAALTLQAFLRFLTQDAKVPLSVAIAKVKLLQEAQLGTTEELAGATLEQIRTIFDDDEKIAKQVYNAAKRRSGGGTAKARGKKRGVENDENAAGVSDAKDTKRTRTSEGVDSAYALSPPEPMSGAALESSLQLPGSTASIAELQDVRLLTNRAPLMLAFVATLLQFTLPSQPLSSRLSLAQAYVSQTSRARAVTLGIEKGEKSAADEGFGEGQPVMKVLGKEIRVLRRWGYEWTEAEGDDAVKDSTKDADDEEPALWALDLEALRTSEQRHQPSAAERHLVVSHSNLPIHTPYSARAYLLKSFDTAPTDMNVPATGNKRPKKESAKAKAAEKEQNLGHLLRALSLVYDSWMPILSPAELEQRTWAWYVAVRPDVADGAAGWGGKNVVRVSAILALQRDAS